MQEDSNEQLSGLRLDIPNEIRLGGVFTKPMPARSYPLLCRVPRIQSILFAGEPKVTTVQIRTEWFRNSKMNFYAGESEVTAVRTTTGPTRRVRPGGPFSRTSTSSSPGTPSSRKAPGSLWASAARSRAPSGSPSIRSPCSGK
jgi:hypothetical protein